MKTTLRSLIRLLVLFVLGIGHPVVALAAQTDYVVGAQDVLTITVFGEPELSGKYTVELDGTFTYPQIGRVKAGGSTLRALEVELKQRLADGYLKNPQVAVAIENYRSQKILIMGEVRLPGEYQLNGQTTLLAALARAGSTTPSAGRQAIIVRPPKPGALAPLTSRPLVALNDEPDTSVIRIDLRDLQSGSGTLNIALQDGDTINIPKAQSVFVSGQVKSPGAYGVERGTTVLQILALAGGMTDRGSDGRIRIIRVIDGAQKELKAKLTDIVEPGDTIVVQERFF